MSGLDEAAEAALAAWLDERTGTTAGIDVEPIRGGGSCEMFRIVRDPDTWVLRRAPLARVSDTAHQVVREARIMEVLAGSEVPVPEVLGWCEDATVLGAPFFVMSHVEGEVVRRDGLPADYLAHPASQTRIGEELVDTLAALHAFDWRSSTLVDLSRPDGFLRRQVDRWLTQLASYRSRDLPGLDDVAAWLTAHLPTTGDLAVMHGDYKIDNVLWSPQAPPRIRAVLDFEMTTVGDPLVDLAWMLIFWPEAGNPIALAAPGTPDGMSADHCQSPGELIERYADATGRDLAHLDWYHAFSAWKLAIVLEGSYTKHLAGESRNPAHASFGAVVDLVLERAARFTR